MSPEAPKFRPLERFWPYAELSEQPTDEELASLDPELRDALRADAASVLDHARLSAARRAGLFARARALARPRVSRTGSGAEPRYRVRFWPADAERLRQVFEIVGRGDATEVLIDDRPVPYARQLWLPLVWFFIQRSTR
jgi:hypothetical protein